MKVKPYIILFLNIAFCIKITTKEHLKQKKFSKVYKIVAPKYLNNEAFVKNPFEIKDTNVTYFYINFIFTRKPVL